MIKMIEGKTPALFGLVCGLLFAFASGVPFGAQDRAQGQAPAAGQGSVQADLLAKILEKTSYYCYRLERISLDFVCREEIEEHQFHPPVRLASPGGSGRGAHVSLAYDYQLVRSGPSIEEKRILLEENGHRRNEPDAPLKTKLYKHKNLVFGPVGLFGEAWQSRHTYRLLGEEMVDKDKAFLVEAAPSGDPEPSLIYGKVWVRESDFAILKIEWDQRSLGNFGAIEAMARTIGHEAEPKIEIVGTYGIEKNGVRFLSRLTVYEDYDSKVGKVRASQTEVRYKDYKFFIVETEVRY
jgi:hypothetical protein